MACADHPETMPLEVVEDSQQSEQPEQPAAEHQAQDDASNGDGESSPWECLSSPNQDFVDSQADEMCEEGEHATQTQEPVAIPSEEIVLVVNDNGGNGSERRDHYHEHHHVHVRKTILKDNGHHVHLNQSKRVHVTEVHHHHHIHIKHIHIYDKSGKAWFSRLATSSDGSSLHSEDSLPASQSMGEPSEASDSQ